jgi:hypothetical protein
MHHQLPTTLVLSAVSQPLPTSATQAESARINHSGTSPPTMPIG